MYHIVAPFPFLSSVPGWNVLEAVPSTILCHHRWADAVSIVTNLPPRLVALSQRINQLIVEASDRVVQVFALFVAHGCIVPVGEGFVKA